MAHKGIMKGLQCDGVRIFRGLSENCRAVCNRRASRAWVTIHDLIFMRHPEYYNWIDTKIYTYKFRQACREATASSPSANARGAISSNWANVNPDKIDDIPEFQSSLQHQMRWATTATGARQIHVTAALSAPAWGRWRSART